MAERVVHLGGKRRPSGCPRAHDASCVERAGYAGGTAALVAGRAAMAAILCGGCHERGSCGCVMCSPPWQLLPPGRALGSDGAGALQRHHHAGARVPLGAELLRHQRYDHEQRREEGKVGEDGASDAKPCAAAAHEERDRFEVVQRQVLVDERHILALRHPGILALPGCWLRGAELEARRQTHLGQGAAGGCGCAVS